MLLLDLRHLIAAIAVILAASGSAPSKPPSSSLMLVSAAEPGQRLTLEGHVVDGFGRPVPGAQLHVYQTDASGRYTPERPMDEPHARLSGRVRTDSRGRFDLRTIRPGGYPKPLRLGDRERKIPAHIHVDISAAGYASRKVQVVFADDPLLSDHYWQDWVKRLHHSVVSVSHDGPTQTTELVLRLQRTASP